MDQKYVRRLRKQYAETAALMTMLLPKENTGEKLDDPNEILGASHKTI
jgi:hypothetical protein